MGKDKGKGKGIGWAKCMHSTNDGHGQPTYKVLLDSGFNSRAF